MQIEHVQSVATVVAVLTEKSRSLVALVVQMALQVAFLRVGLGTFRTREFGYKKST